MDYQKIYDQIVIRARSENRKKKQGIYYENHHILPRGLGGSDIDENLVLLTAREHYICHRLLVEIYVGNSTLAYALWMMVHSKTKFQQRDYKISSREYERHRIMHAENVSKNQSGENSSFYGVHRYGEDSYRWGMTHTEETKLKISITKTGVTMSVEVREAISKGHSGEKSIWFDVHRYGEDNPNFGHLWTEEMKLRDKEIMLNKEDIICPYCGVSGHPSIMKRWHFDNCKMNPNREKKLLFKCDWCDYTSENEVNIRRRHNDKCKENPDRIITIYECEFCGFTSTEKGHITNHKRFCELNPEGKARPIITCEYCGLQSTNQANMTRFHGDKCPSPNNPLNEQV